MKHFRFTRTLDEDRKRVNHNLCAATFSNKFAEFSILHRYCVQGDQYQCCDVVEKHKAFKTLQLNDNRMKN